MVTQMMEEVKEKVAQLLSNDHSGHGMDHINRVLELSLKFASKENANKEIVTLIAYLHDVDDHKIFGMKCAEELTHAKRIMEECKIKQEIQEQVLKELHNFGYSKRLKGYCPTTIEGKIVSDADMCDALGAHGILRVYRFSLKHGNPFFDRNTFPREKMSAQEYSGSYAGSSVNHIFEKILNLKSYMLTVCGKEEAERRYQIIVNFLFHFFEEENANDWVKRLEKCL